MQASRAIIPCVMTPVILAGSPLFYVVLTAIGLGIGVYGTLVGLGGGVILLPVLLFLFPGTPPEVLTGISLSVVFLNAFSGTLAYIRQRRIDYRSGFLFALATIPGTVIGVWLLKYISASAFRSIFGVLLLAISLLIFLRPQLEAPRLLSGRGSVCSLTDSSGKRFIYRVNRVLGTSISFLVGFVAGLLGIGGGVIHVPAMVYLLCFPVHVATATSHFILVFTTLTGVLSHVAFYSGIGDWLVVIFLALGIIPGAQLGAYVSRHLHGNLIVRLLALALVILGIRLLFLF
jgi:uncharacterized membrane protein YfcA